MSADNISANFVACRKKSINHRSLPGLPLAADISRGIAIYSDAYSIKCIQNMSLIERMAAMSYGQGADAKISAGWRDQVQLRCCLTPFRGLADRVLPTMTPTAHAGPGRT